MILRLSIASMLCWMSCPAWAYEVETHAEISGNAVSASNIAVKLAALGLTSRVSSTNDTRFDSNRSIAQVILDGSKSEDDIISSERWPVSPTIFTILCTRWRRITMEVSMTGCWTASPHRPGVSKTIRTCRSPNRNRPTLTRTGASISTGRSRRLANLIAGRTSC